MYDYAFLLIPSRWQ